MGLGRWFTKNWANTTEPTHPDLAPLRLPGDPAAAREQLRRAVASLRGWAVASETADTMHLTRTTRLFRFVDDIRLTFTPAGSGTVVHAESRSRVGTGDLGQNRRNILELWAAVRRGIPDAR